MLTLDYGIGRTGGTLGGGGVAGWSETEHKAGTLLGNIDDKMKNRHFNTFQSGIQHGPRICKSGCYFGENNVACMCNVFILHTTFTRVKLFLA